MISMSKEGLDERVAGDVGWSASSVVVSFHVSMEVP